MLTEIDERVLAAVNLHAVLGALPKLSEVAPDASRLLGELAQPVRLTARVMGGESTSLVFARDGIRLADGDSGATTRATLAFRSPAHLNAVLDGTGSPLPIAGPAGIRFLTQVFTPISDLLGRYLRPSDAELADPAFTDAHRILLLEVAVGAIAIVANRDRSGRFSADQMSDGDLDIAVGDALRHRLRVREHRLSRVPVTDAAPRAVFRFADLQTVGDVLAGRESALACVGDGRIAIRGYIPLVDNTSRILDRVGHYLGK
ncbi:hypothetical protein ACIQLK_13740 [Microbacterium sp. NPDC091382]|uniref:hypothetical protein n=1 Tax=Microbacterium sp. NPDC091382 TaxID=3364210 RepID=UPI0038302420